MPAAPDPGPSSLAPPSRANAVSALLLVRYVGLPRRIQPISSTLTLRCAYAIYLSGQPPRLLVNLVACARYLSWACEGSWVASLLGWNRSSECRVEEIPTEKPRWLLILMLGCSRQNPRASFFIYLVPEKSM